MNFSSDFLMGCSILSKYMQENITVSVAETSAILVHNLKKISDNDLASLGALNWECGNHKEAGYAEFYDLNYADY